MPSFADIFNSTPVEDRGGDELPVGNYTTKVVWAGTTTSQNGNFGVLFRHACIEPGPHEGDTTLVTAYLTDKSKGMFVETLGKYGITGEMLDSDPDAAVQAALDQIWTVNIVQQKNKPEYTNTYLRKRITDEESAVEEVATPAAPKGKRPF